MEKRIAKVMFSAAGGTASAGSKTCKLALPSSWLAKMGITNENRNVELQFTGDEIRIRLHDTYDTFLQSKIAMGHEIYRLNYIMIGIFVRSFLQISPTKLCMLRTERIIW